MLGKTHIDMSLVVAEALNWKGDVKLLARNAQYPDSVRSIEVEGVGAHVFGHNLAALVHFARPLGGGKFEGYNYKLDHSKPSFDISSRKVLAKPDAWGAPIVEPLTLEEPFGKLWRDLAKPEHKGSLEADQITYTATTVMAEWVEACYHWCLTMLKGDELRQALDTLAGWACHLGAQDPAVPHHAACVLLAGHSAFEGDVDELWHKLRGDGTIAKLLDTMIRVDCQFSSLRGLAEDTITRAYVAPRKLEWRCFWRVGWNKTVKACVLRGLGSTVQTIKLLKKLET